eukprot:gb/GECG01011377.1/.p1 GENE.gb/GECG01011377.1/~~gb/GECG01011377.1/.p1  ORF type:complete len:433 (+),score=35.43 gb/GECG01011377.1/:1-1299(+)
MCAKEAGICVNLVLDSLRQTTYADQVNRYGTTFRERCHEAVPWLFRKHDTPEIVPELMDMTYNDDESDFYSLVNALRRCYSTFGSKSAQRKPIVSLTGVNSSGKSRSVVEFAKTSGIPLVIKVRDGQLHEVWNEVLKNIQEYKGTESEKSYFASRCFRRCIAAHFDWAELVAKVLVQEKESLKSLASKKSERVEDIWRLVLILALRDGFCSSNVATLYKDKTRPDDDIQAWEETLKQRFQESTGASMNGHVVLCFDDAHILALKLLGKKRTDRPDSDTLWLDFREEIRALSQRDLVVLCGTGVKMPIHSPGASVQEGLIFLSERTTFGVNEVKKVLRGYLTTKVMDMLSDELIKSLCGRVGIVGNFLVQFIRNTVAVEPIPLNEAVNTSMNDVRQGFFFAYQRFPEDPWSFRKRGVPKGFSYFLRVQIRSWG